MSYTFVVIPGSLREASYHRALSRSLQTLAPEDVHLDIFELHDIPIYNQDVENAGMPAPVVALHEAIAASDGVIWVTPEYNGSMSGVIKNAVDWASRKQGLLAKRPATVISGSPGALGATKGQESLRASVNHLGMYVLARPSLAIPKIQEKLEDDSIKDEGTANMVRDWLKAFRDWVAQLS